MIDVNIKAVHILTKKFLPDMIARNEGYILNVASVAGLMPAGPYMATYYATKAYVTSFTSAIAEELEKKSNVYVGSLCPGPVDTEFNQVADVKFNLKGITSEYCVNYALDKMYKRKKIIVPTIFAEEATLLVEAGAAQLGRAPDEQAAKRKNKDNECVRPSWRRSEAGRKDRTGFSFFLRLSCDRGRRRRLNGAPELR